MLQLFSPVLFFDWLREDGGVFEVAVELYLLNFILCYIIPPLTTRSSHTVLRSSPWSLISLINPVDVRLHGLHRPTTCLSLSHLRGFFFSSSCPHVFVVLSLRIVFFFLPPLLFHSYYDTLISISSSVFDVNECLFPPLM